jgi:hypothetical protein
MIFPKKKRTLVLASGEVLSLRHAIRRANKAKREAAAKQQAGKAA